MTAQNTGQNTGKSTGQHAGQGTGRHAGRMTRRPDDEQFYATLGRRIRAVREEQALTQAQLGARLHPPVTRASIANVEAGKQRVLAHTLVQIARVLHAPLDQLAADEPQAGDVPAAIERELKVKLALSPAALGRLTKAVRRGERRA